MVKTFWYVILPIICGIAANLITGLILAKCLYNGKKGKDEESLIPKRVQATQFMVPIFVSLCIFLSEFRWVLNNAEKVLVVICAFLFSIFLVILHLYSFKRKWYPWMTQVLIISTLFTTLYIADMMIPKYIRYNCSSVVNNEVFIKGRVSGFMDEYYIYPVVYAPQGVGWVQEIAQPDQNNIWYSHVNFGGSSGEHYKLMVYASKDDLNLIRGHQILMKDLSILTKKAGVIKGPSCDVKIR